MSFISKLLGKRNRRADELPPPADPIDAFWVWWRAASGELANAYEAGTGPSGALVEAISEHVRAMDKGLAWETGPGTRSAHHFALSPEGDAGLRILTQRWLSRAPKPCQNWEYFPTRQGSGADARRTLRIHEREFDYGAFLVSAELDESRAAVNIVVYHPLFVELSEDERLLPTFLFLDDVLGEDGVTSWVGTVDTSTVRPDNGGPSRALADAVQQVRDTWNDDVVTLLEGQREGAPVIAAVRLGLKRLDHLLHDHHLELAMVIREPSDTGLHSADEGEELNDFEQGLIEELSHQAIWIGHETHAGKRLVHFHADSNPAIQDAILRYCQANAYWQTELSVTHDPSWGILKRY